MLIVGLTGGIGAGKSAAAAEFARLGAHVIDVDALGRAVLEPGGRAHAGVLAEFGAGIEDTDGRIDRAALARTVFGDRAALDRLTAISHPAINDELADRIDALRAATPRPPAVVLDMAILAESNLGRGDAAHRYTVVVTIEAPTEVRVRRAVDRGMDEADVRRRIAAQATDEQRRAVADFVLVNDGTEVDLAAIVAECWSLLRQRMV